MVSHLSPPGGTTTSPNTKDRVGLTFEARDLLALGLAEERQLIGDRFQHLDKVGQEEDDLNIVVGEVPSTADTLSALDMRPTEQGNCRPLVNIFWIQPGIDGKEA